MKNHKFDKNENLIYIEKRGEKTEEYKIRQKMLN